MDAQAMQKLRKEITALRDQEELIWHQWTKEDWLKYGDRNTKFFHTSAKKRQQNSQLGKIQNKEGRVWESQEGNGNSFVAYYSRLFTA